MLGDGCAARQGDLSRLEKWGLPSRKAALQGKVLVIVDDISIPAFLTPVCTTQQQNVRFTHSHVPGQTPTCRAKDALMTPFGCSRSQLTAAMPIFPSASCLGCWGDIQELCGIQSPSSASLHPIPVTMGKWELFRGHHW